MNAALTLVVLAGYFGLLMLVSAFSGRQRGNDAFFTANRKAPWYVVSIGMIGSSISGVSFVSVPGMVASGGFQYLQMVLGFFAGYILLAKILLPVYYRLESPSIYTWLLNRFGSRTYRTGAWFFLLSKALGASARIYVAVLVLDEFILKAWGIPFGLTTALVILMVWLYTFRGGNKTIVWTDMLQTIVMLAAMVLILLRFAGLLHLDASGVADTVRNSPWSYWFNWDWSSKGHFIKQFLSGVFVVLVMTGLDQEMIQKNRTIRRLDQAQTNMLCYGFLFLPVNLIFLIIGVLMYTYVSKTGVGAGIQPDALLPWLVTNELTGSMATILLVIGIVSATLSGADSSMTSWTTSFCVDILDKADDARTRKMVHAGVAVLFIGLVLLFRALNSLTLLDAIYTLASYTYGPLLGLFAFGLSTKRLANDRLTPIIALSSPLVCYGMQALVHRAYGYETGYELLMLNGLLTFAGLWLTSSKRKSNNSTLHGN